MLVLVVVVVVVTQDVLLGYRFGVQPYQDLARALRLF